MYCDPERLQALQRLFDTIWVAAKLRASKQNSRCSDALRDEIARCVMDCAKTDMTDGDIFLAVSEVLDIWMPADAPVTSSDLRGKLNRLDQNKFEVGDVRSTIAGPQQ